MKFKLLSVISAFLLLASFSLSFAFGARRELQENLGQEYEESEGFVLHEWGVIHQELPGYNRKLDDLPAFVRNVHEESTKLLGMEELIRQKPDPDVIGGAVAKKPIIYVYGKEGDTFDLSVYAPRCAPMYVWPTAAIEWKSFENKVKEGAKKMRFGKAPNMLAMTWKGVQIAKRLNVVDLNVVDLNVVDLKEVKKGHWFEMARDVSAPGLICGKESEKFLFYETALSYAQGPLKVERKGDEMSFLFSSQHEALDFFIVDVSEKGLKLHYRESIGGPEKIRKEKKIETAELVSIAAKDVEAKTSGFLQESLIKAGLYGKEAKGMVDIWRKDLFEKPGTRIVYRLTQKEYDEIFPLSVSKEPDSVVRVMLVVFELK